MASLRGANTEQLVNAMENTRMKRLAVMLGTAILLLAGVAPVALAAESGWYTGAGLGASRGELKDGVVDQLNSVSNSITRDRDSLMWKVFLGYNFTSFVALEASAFNLGEFSMSGDIPGVGMSSARTEFWGGSVDALALLPLGNWRLFGRAGVVYGKTDVHANFGSGLPANSEEWNVGYKVGAGVGYEFASGVAFRAEWEHYRIDNVLEDDPTGVDLDVDVVSASVLYRFK
jgi:opacity protein-like surface antigen